MTLNRTNWEIALLVKVIFLRREKKWKGRARDSKDKQKDERLAGTSANLYFQNWNEGTLCKLCHQIDTNSRLD